MGRLTYISPWGDGEQRKGVRESAYFAIGEVPQLGAHEMQQQETFKPRGALAFFILMLLFYGVAWLSVYVEVLSRR
jgi:hypothetical protein